MQTIGQLGPGTGGDLPARPFLELRGAAPFSKTRTKGRRTKIRTLLPPDIQRFGHGVEGDAPFSALSSEVVRAQRNGDEESIANYFV